MSVNMQGPWTVAVKSKSADFAQRFIISNATSGNGTYAGEVTTPHVLVTGDHWSITIQNKPTGGDWVDSADQITFPTTSGLQYHFDIQSNDAGGDQDFNDLILTCSTPQTPTDFVIYGNVSYYQGVCIFNPCRKDWLAIETASALANALKNPYLRVPIEKLYPYRLKPVPRMPPGPTPDPPPFRPLVIPLCEQTALPAKQAQVFRLAAPEVKTRTAKGEAIADAQPSVVSSRTVVLEQTWSAATLEFDRLAVARIADHIFRICITGHLPGVALKFQEYDRTMAELAGGAYTGDGNREDLGACATDRNGNYIFRFSRSLAELAQEVDVDVAPGESAATQILPDVIVQLLDPSKPLGYCYESAPYWNIPTFKRIDICVPRDYVPPPMACQGGRAIQAIGDIFIVDPNNTLDGDGRITAKSSLPNTRPARCAAWSGSLDLFACFLDHPDAIYYTIRFKKPGDTDWSFFQEKYTYLHKKNLGPGWYQGDLGGPDPNIPALQVDGGVATKVPAYHNFENCDWVQPRYRKAVISSWLYAPAGGTASFKIEGYNAAGNKVAGAEDTIKLYIDNNNPVFDIFSVKMLDQSGGDCALFTVPADQPNAPLTVQFRANQQNGFLNAYSLGVRKGNIGGVAVDGLGPGAISDTYVHTSDVVCSQLEGTFADVTHDAQGYVVANIKPHTGNWLDANQPFCTFAVQLSCSVRRTNGYNDAVCGFGPTEYWLGIQKS
jgi:hypothetical protein